MQNSELYRRGVVLPMSNAALNALRESNVTEETEVKFAEIQEQEDFEWLWEKGFFSDISQVTQSLLDDYEETEIDYIHTEAIIRMIHLLDRKSKSIPRAVESFCKQLSKLLELNRQQKSPIFFIL